MLPGFRFLFAAIVLSISILVFGLGAAALLRAAHVEFAGTASWRAIPEPKFAQQNDAPGETTRETASEAPEAVLAMLRLEPEPAEQKPPESIPAATVAAEPTAIIPAPEPPEKIAALTPQDPTPPKAAIPEIPAAEMSAQSEPPASIPAPSEEARIATAAPVLPPAAEAVAPAPEPAIVPAPAADTDLIALKIATLGGPPVTIEAEPSVKSAGAGPDRSAARKRVQARRAKERRRLAQRARAAAVQQRAADPFAQPTAAAQSR